MSDLSDMINQIEKELIYSLLIPKEILTTMNTNFKWNPPKEYSISPKITADSFIWTDKRGRQQKASQMSTDHLFNAIEYCYNRIVSSLWRTKEININEEWHGQIGQEGIQILKILLEEFGKRDNIEEKQWEIIKLMLPQIKRI